MFRSCRASASEAIFLSCRSRIQASVWHCTGVSRSDFTTSWRAAAALAVPCLAPSAACRAGDAALTVGSAYAVATRTRSRRREGMEQSKSKCMHCS